MKSVNIRKKSESERISDIAGVGKMVDTILYFKLKNSISCLNMNCLSA